LALAAKGSEGPSFKSIRPPDFALQRKKKPPRNMLFTGLAELMVDHMVMEYDM
jgi:hypothetical protein